MSDMVAPTAPRRRYQAKRSVAMAAYPGLTPGSAHSKEMRTVPAYLALVRAAAKEGNRVKLARLRAQVMAAEAELAGGSECVVTELQDVQRISQQGTTARLAFALSEMTAADEDRLLAVVVREIAEHNELAAALEARKAAR